MFPSPIFKTTAITATVIFIGASAQAATVASIALTNGTYEVGSSIDVGGFFPTPVGPALQITADFAASLTPFDLNLTQDFVLAAGLTVDGEEILDENEVITGVTGGDLLDDAATLFALLPPELFAILGNALDEILDGDNQPSEIEDGVFLNFAYDLTGTTATSVAGSFIATLSSEATTFFFGGPSALGGTFDGFATVSTIAPVPLPASSLILLSGLGAFAAIRRKQSTKA